MKAAEWLGLSHEESETLFYAHGVGINIEAITAKMAVICLRNFAETGEVDWRHAVIQVEDLETV